MCSSIYRVQSSTRRLPIRALFGFMLKQLSPILPFPSESLVWWFVLGSPWVASHNKIAHSILRNRSIMSAFKQKTGRKVMYSNMPFTHSETRYIHHWSCSTWVWWLMMCLEGLRLCAGCQKTCIHTRLSGTMAFWCSWKQEGQHTMYLCQWLSCRMSSLFLHGPVNT